MVGGARPTRGGKRPKPTSHDDPGGTVTVSGSRATAATRTTGARDDRLTAPEAGVRRSIRGPAITEPTISSCWACCDPIEPTRTKLALSAPAIAPTVLDA